MSLTLEYSDIIINYLVVFVVFRKVLKEIPVGDLQPDETVDAMHEASLLRNLDHPGIIRFHDSFIDGEFFCIVTEYAEVCLLLLHHSHTCTELYFNIKIFLVHIPVYEFFCRALCIL